MEKSQVAFKCPVPNFTQFCNRKTANPLERFYEWLLEEMGQPTESTKFTLDVTSVYLSTQDAAKLKEKLTKWALKYEVDRGKLWAKKAVSYEWRDIGPNEFYDGLPAWAEEGHVYVLKGWRLKKPKGV